MIGQTTLCLCWPDGIRTTVGYLRSILCGSAATYGRPGGLGEVEHDFLDRHGNPVSEASSGFLVMAGISVGSRPDWIVQTALSSGWPRWARRFAVGIRFEGSIERLTQPGSGVWDFRGGIAGRSFDCILPGFTGGSFPVENGSPTVAGPGS